MTKKEAVLLSAYTGFLLTNNFSDVHKFCEELLDRPIWTHEFASETVQKEIREKCKPMVIEMVKSEIDDHACCDKGKTEEIKVMLDVGSKVPTRAHATDAGLDLYARDSAIVPAKESCVFDTGIHVEIPEGYFGLLLSKSGLNVKHGITSEGVIDCGYTGSIKVKLYNNSGYDYKVNVGDKISQLIIIPCMLPKVKLVDSLKDTERADQGFGSSGR